MLFLIRQAAHHDKYVSDDGEWRDVSNAQFFYSAEEAAQEAYFHDYLDLEVVQAEVHVLEVVRHLPKDDEIDDEEE